MALSAKFSLPHPELDDFLFAEMGEEESGMPLSVLSALTRLGLDPRVEGARLSDLPRGLAARRLVPMIEMFPTREKRGASETQALAKRLVALLPRRSSRGRATGAVASGDLRRAGFPGLRLVGTGLFLVLIGMAVFGLLPGQ